MKMLQHIIDSATGETVGDVNIVGMDDEAILAFLHRKGYLAGGPDYYEISRCFPFAEGEIVVVDIETNVPVLKLELPPESEVEAA
jgi:hypothetical protein